MSIFLKKIIGLVCDDSISSLCEKTLPNNSILALNAIKNITQQIFFGLLLVITKTLASY